MCVCVCARLQTKVIIGKTLRENKGLGNTVTVYTCKGFFDDQEVGTHTHTHTAHTRRTHIAKPCSPSCQAPLHIRHTADTIADTHGMCRIMDLSTPSHTVLLQVVVKSCTLANWWNFQTFSNEIQAHVKLQGRKMFMPLLAAELDFNTGIGTIVMPRMDKDLLG